MTKTVLRGALRLSDGAVCSAVDGEDGSVDGRHFANCGWRCRVLVKWENEEGSCAWDGGTMDSIGKEDMDRCDCECE